MDTFGWGQLGQKNGNPKQNENSSRYQFAHFRFRFNQNCKKDLTLRELTESMSTVLKSEKKGVRSPDKIKKPIESPPKSQLKLLSWSLLGHLSGQKPFEEGLEHVLEDVFGLSPRPHIDGQDLL